MCMLFLRECTGRKFIWHLFRHPQLLVGKKEEEEEGKIKIEFYEHECQEASTIIERRGSMKMRFRGNLYFWLS